jgi:hypothetical protein
MGLMALLKRVVGMLKLYRAWDTARWEGVGRVRVHNVMPFPHSAEVLVLTHRGDYSRPSCTHLKPVLHTPEVDHA